MIRKDSRWWYGEEALRFFEYKVVRAAQASVEAAGTVETVQEMEWSSAKDKKLTEESVVIARVIRTFGGKELYDLFRSTYLDNPGWENGILDLTQKVEDPWTVQGFAQARGIAQRLHEFTGIASHVYFMTLMHHAVKTIGFKELVRYAVEQEPVKSASESHEWLKGIEPLARKIMSGFVGCLAIDYKLEQLGWSPRSEWPDYSTLEIVKPAQIRDEMQRRVVALEEREGLKTLDILRAHADGCSYELEEVSAAIEDVESEEWDGFGVFERPLTHAIFEGRLHRFKNQLHSKNQVFRRLIRDYLGGGLQPEEQDRDEDAGLRNERSVANKIIKAQREKIKALRRRDGKPTQDAMKKIMDRHRYASSGRVNYRAVAMELGCSDKTAKRWIEELRLLGYAEAQ